MNINKVCIMFVTLVACGFSEPVFTVDGSCIYKVDKKRWFQSLTILNVSTNEHYLIRRNYEYDGTFDICFPVIPVGYHVLRSNDTLSNNIPIEEGQIIEIVNFGGDRGTYGQIYQYANGQLIEISDEMKK